MMGIGSGAVEVVLFGRGGLWVEWVGWVVMGRMGRGLCVGLGCRCRALCTAVQINDARAYPHYPFYPSYPLYPSTAMFRSWGLLVKWVILGSYG